MTDWGKLEKDFRDIPDPYLSMRADRTDQERFPNLWEIKGGIDEYARDRFKAYAKQAGRLLLNPNAQSISKCSTNLRTIEDDMSRWLTAVKEITNKFEYLTTGKYPDGETLSLGKIDRIIDVSATLCSQLSTEETTTPSTQVESEVILSQQELHSDETLKDIESSEKIILLSGYRHIKALIKSTNTWEEFVFNETQAKIVEELHKALNYELHIKTF